MDDVNFHKSKYEAFFMVDVASNDGGTVKVRVPLKLMKIIMSSSKTKGLIDFNGVDVDLDVIKTAVCNNKLGKIIDMTTDGNRVVIRIE